MHIGKVKNEKETIDLMKTGNDPVNINRRLPENSL